MIKLNTFNFEFHKNAFVSLTENTTNSPPVSWNNGHNRCLLSELHWRSPLQNMLYMILKSGLRDKTKVLYGQTRYTTFLTHLSHPLHHSPSVCCQSSVSYNLSVGTVGNNLQIPGTDHHWKNCLLFGVFYFQIVLQDISSMGQPPPLQSMVANIAVCACDILGSSGCLSSSSLASCISCLLVPQGLQLIRFMQSSLKLG